MKPSPSQSSTLKWIDPQWLKSNLDSLKPSIIDCQPEVYDYIKGHIPGAVYINEQHFRHYSKNLPTVFSSVNMIENLLSSASISNSRPLVVYGSNGLSTNCGDGLEQSMVAYSLVRYGHKDVYLLDGGLEKWISEGLELISDYPEVPQTEFVPLVKSELFVNYKQLLELINYPGVALVDVRPRTVYEGQGIWPKPGHIPGAVSLPWRVLMDHDNPRLLRPDPQIKELANTRGITPDKTVILYCGTGREATSAFLIFKYLLDYPNVAIYEGSFTEWCQYPQNKTVTGPNPS